VAEKVAFRFAPASRTGDIVLDAKGLFAARGGRRLFEGIELLVRCVSCSHDGNPGEEQ